MAHNSAALADDHSMAIGRDVVLAINAAARFEHTNLGSECKGQRP